MSVSSAHAREKRRIPRSRGRAPVLAVLFAGAALAQTPGTVPPARIPGPELLNRAVRAFQSARYEDAVPAFSELIERYDGEPSWQDRLPRIRFLLGCSLFNLDRMSEAAEHLTASLDARPDGPFRLECIFRLANIDQAEGRLEEALARYDEILDGSPPPDLLRRTRFESAQCLFDAERYEDAVRTLESFLADEPGDLEGDARALLASALLKIGRFEEAEKEARAGIRTVSTLEEAVLVNSTLVEIADRLYENGRPRRALRCYQSAWSPEELLLWQREAVRRLSIQLEMPLSAPNFAALWYRRGLRRRLDLETGRLERLRETAEAEAIVFLRMARCFRALDRPREALIAVETARARDPSGRFARHAALERAMALNDLGRKEEAADVLKRCVERCGNDDVELRLATVSTLLQSGRTAEAAELALPWIDAPSDGARLPECLLVAGRAALAAGDAAAAVRALARLRTEFPESESAGGESLFWHGLALIEIGRTEEAWEPLEEFLAGEDRPETLVHQARYRLALAYRSRGRLSEALDHAERLAAGETAPADLRARAWALVGDLKAALRDVEGALDAYGRVPDEPYPSYRYAVFQSARLLRSKQRFDNEIRILDAFVRKTPPVPDAIEARLLRAQGYCAVGREEEAWADVRAVLDLGGSDPALEILDLGMERLVTLAERGGMAEALATRLARETVRDASLRQARMLFWTHRLREGTLDAGGVRLIAEFPTLEIGPFLGLVCADVLRDRGDRVGARERYLHVLETWPGSRSAPLAAVGMARCALAEDDPEGAAEWVRRAEEGRLPLAERGPIALVRADMLRRSGRIEEALSAYRRILANRSWRGALRPAALYGAGLCHEEARDPRKAFAFYQRIYVLYGGYDEWVARAYLGSARCLEKLDRFEEAMRTYRELLADPRMQRLPECRIAREKLRELAPAREG